jgi:hypothetical protein
MARKKKQTDIEEAITETNAAEQRKNSTLTEDERRALLFQHVKAYEERLAAKKKADADLKNACKVAKADLGKDAVADIKDVIALGSPEGEKALQAEIERKLRIARYVNAAVGHQFTFSEDMRPATDRAYEEGKRVGLAGGQCISPHDHSVPQHDSWMTGFHDGQAILGSAFAKKPVDVAAERTAQDTSDAPFAASVDHPQQAEPVAA